MAGGENESESDSNASSIVYAELIFFLAVPDKNIIIKLGFGFGLAFVFFRQFYKCSIVTTRRFSKAMVIDCGLFVLL